MISLLFIGFACLFPIAIYCLFLAFINARRRPAMLSGPWDFVGVLFATSGFLLVSGPCMLTALNAHWRNRLLQGHWRDFKEVWNEWTYVRTALWGLYFLVIVVGAVFLLWRRRRITVIYNVEPARLDDALSETLDRLRLTWTRTGNRIFIGLLYPSTAAGDSLTAPTVSLELDPFPAMRHVTLRWRKGNESARQDAEAEPARVLVRRDVEAELAKMLAEVETSDNPSAGWFLTASACLFLLLLGLLALFFFVLLPR